MLFDIFLKNNSEKSANLNLIIFLKKLNNKISKIVNIKNNINNLKIIFNSIRK